MKLLRKKQIFMILAVVITTVLALNFLPTLGDPNSWPGPDPDPGFFINMVGNLLK